MTTNKYYRTVGSNKDSLYYVSQSISNNSEVLDVGCWEGSLGEFLIREKSCIVDGIELYHEAGVKAEKFYRNVFFNDLETFESNYIQSTYDYVVCADVLEHVRNPAAVLSELKKLLKPSGKLIVSVPNVAYGGVIAEMLSGKFEYRERGILDNTHYRFFTRDSIVKLVNSLGFGVNRIDAVQAHIKESEFAESLVSEFPFDLKRVLSNTKDSGTYQFVLVCDSDAEKKIIESNIGIDNTIKFQSKVYWANGVEDYCETRSDVLLASLSLRNRLSFECQDLNSECRVRIDVSDFEGYFKIHELRISTDANKILFDMSSSKGGFTTIGCSIEQSHEQYGYLLLKSTSSDSFIEVHIDENSEKPLKVELDFIYVSSLSESDLYSEIENLKDKNRSLERDIQTIDETLHSVLNSSSWRITKPVRLLGYIRNGDKKALKKVILNNISALRALQILRGRGESVSTLTSKAIGILKDEGIQALYRRISRVIRGDRTSRHGNYLSWIKLDDKRSLDKENEMIDFLSKKDGPLISIIMPTYNTEEKYLRFCVESVIRQSYPNWELCIADDASTDENVLRVLKEYQVQDSRIKLVERSENGHISNASNSALEIATGEWLALLDHDDELHKHALSYVVYQLIKNPQTEFVYTDEDKIDAIGNRIDPHFKTDWNLDLLYSQNYVSHLGVYKTDIIRKIGGFRVGYEGSQDYDLLLRYSREINHNNISHIPKVLYHWRILEGSTALASGEKLYTTTAGINALIDHFKVRNENVSVVQGMNPNTYKVRWEINEEPKVSLIIPTYNGHEITKRAIDSILEKTTYKNFEIILVDNNSDDPESLEYFEEVSKHEKVTLLRYPMPFNYSAINNYAVARSTGEIVGLVNNDVEVINKEWLSEMVSFAIRKDIGCVGAKLYYPDNTIQHAGVVLGIGGVAGHSHKHFHRSADGYFSRLKLVQNISAVTAACLIVRKDIYNQVGGLNENDLKVAFNDVDFCLKVRQMGYNNLWTPYAELYHYESISRGLDTTPTKARRFNKEKDYMVNSWGGILSNDFYYSSNLTLEHEDFSLR
ncbi:glycosyltransferase [Enterovibrio baiacu]|uniref:glycosyltransferase n=1 Tax=Enterovibrio baiacu TaxID=2491023 RepID=UPI001011698F|nr:glycosyltransferase [Enterovibrio baiacu]MBE1274789.1 glycosyltransferase [Enterovibrio baiacu]